jgi:phosphoglycerate dehydrogenase-like enzyme
MPKHHLLYVYEERIPQNLRDLVMGLIPTDEFEVDSMTYLTPDDEKKAKLAWADAVLFAPGRQLPDEILAHAKNVKLMQLWSSGFEKFNHQGAAKLGIPVANNGGANAGSVAEHAILLMLAVYKWLPNSHWRTVTGNWTGNSHGMDMFMLNQKTLGVVGFGNIGRQVARKLKGFDMDVVYYDINRAPEEIEQEYGVRFRPLDDLLKESDIVTLHLHFNDSTKNIIGARELGLMKKNAVLINVSRAQLVDYDALLAALRDKRIHGAGMDVYLEEPTKGDDPLLQLPNVVATPHMAGSTYDVYFRAVGNCIENIRRAVRGEPLQWVVNHPAPRP